MQGEKPYRGARAGFKQRRRHFYEAQDRLQEVSLRIWNIRVRRREFETATDAHCEVVGRFGSLADDVDADHVIWADLTDFYPELWAAFTDITAEPSQSSRPRHWQPRARGEAAASAGGAAVGAPQPEAAASEPKAPAAAPPLGVRGSTRDLYFPRRSDPLQQRGRTAQTEEVVPDEGARPASEPPPGNREVDLTTAGGTAQGTDLRSARRARTPPSRRVREEAGFEELRLRSAALASFTDAGDLEPEVVQQAPGAEETEDIEVEVEAEADDDRGAAQGAPDDEPAQEGLEPEGVEEEEVPEEDVEREDPPADSEATVSPAASEAAAPAVASPAGRSS